MQVGERGAGIGNDVNDSGLITGDRNRQTDQSNRVNINLEDYTRQERSRQEREGLSMGDRLRDLERTVYGDSRFGIAGVLAECKMIRETVNDIQKTVHHDQAPPPSSHVLLWVVGIIVSVSALADLWAVIFR